MPEHVHLVIVPKLPEYPVKRVVAAIKQYFARRVIGRWKAMRAPILARVVAPDGSHRFWQHGGGYDRNPRDEAELWEKINYVHNNPVTRGLVNLPTDYLWSSARWYTGLRSHGLPAIDPLDV